MNLLILMVSGIFRFFEFSQSWLKRGAKYAIIGATFPIVAFAARYISFSYQLLTTNNLFGLLMGLAKTYAPTMFDFMINSPDIGEILVFMFYITGGEMMVWAWVCVLIPVLAVLMVLKAVMMLVNLVSKVFA